jgi:hypothetical protein
MPIRGLQLGQFLVECYLRLENTRLCTVSGSERAFPENMFHNGLLAPGSQAEFSAREQSCTRADETSLRFVFWL